MRIYCKWGGKPNGTPEDVSRCIAEVPSGWLYKQCARKRGHGPDGLYCKQHGKKAAAGEYVCVPEEKQ